MPPKGSETLDREHGAAAADQRIKLLAALAGELASRGLVEEAVEACKAIVRLRRELGEAAGPGEAEPTAGKARNPTRSAA